jgi:CHAT domain-containing protein
LHAAGYWTGGQPEGLSDYAVSSYIPTLTALLNARANTVDGARKSSKILILTSLDSGDLPKLPHTRIEANVIEQMVPPESLLPRGDMIQKVDSVIDQIPQADVVHFACHGQQINADPLQSGFELSDGRLTLKHLMHLHIPDGQLAYLSACESAAADSNQPDEAVNIATAMLYVGFKSVIATMW